MCNRVCVIQRNTTISRITISRNRLYHGSSLDPRIVQYEIDWGRIAIFENLPLSLTKFRTKPAICRLWSGFKLLSSDYIAVIRTELKLPIAISTYFCLWSRDLPGYHTLARGEVAPSCCGELTNKFDRWTPPANQSAVYTKCRSTHEY